MYRFSRADNESAQHFFARAIGLDPTFARAHAGLSFTHWQDAFQGWPTVGPPSSAPTKPLNAAWRWTIATLQRMSRSAARCGCKRIRIARSAS
jgi:hypothetical protein